MVLTDVKIKVRKNGFKKTRCFIVEEISSFADIVEAIHERFGEIIEILEIYFNDDEDDAIDVRDQSDFEAMERLYNIDNLMVVIKEWPTRLS